MRVLAIIVVASCATEGPPIPTGAHHQYVVDSIVAPANGLEARRLAIDLDGDGDLDNQLGSAFAALQGRGFDLKAPIDRAIARGELAMLLDVQTDDFVDSNGTGFQIVLGKDPSPSPCLDANDMVCGRHLDGTGRFASVDDRHAALVGRFEDGVLSSQRGATTIQMVVLGDQVIELELLGARVQITEIDERGIASAIVAGGVTRDGVRDRVVPAFHAAALEVIAQDCDSDCRCLQGSRGKFLIDLFDTQPRDCSLELGELREAPVVLSLTAPDLIIDDVETTSFAIQITAVPATFPGVDPL